MSRASADGPAGEGGPWPLVPWVVPAIAVLFSRLQVVDLAYQIPAGQLMWHSWSVLRADPFTYSIPGSPWLDQQWGAQLAFSAWFHVGGWKGLIVLQAVIVGCSFGATYRATLSNGASVVVAACATAAGFIVAAALPGALALRPQLLALPLFVTTAWILRGREVGSERRLLLLVPIGVLWANIHGSFVLLSLMLAIACIADVIGRRPTARWTGSLLAFSLLAPWATPWGGSVYGYLWDLARSPIVRRVITEWQPIWTRPVAALLFAAACLAVVAIARRARRAPTFEEAATFLVFTGLAVWSQRNVLWWSVAIPPLAGGLLAGWQPGGAWSRVATRVAVGCLAGLVLLGVWWVGTTPESELLAEAPYGITAWLTAHPDADGHVFAEWWGWWFEYAAPNEPMFVDARVEIFPPGVWSDYGAIVDVEDDWTQVVDRWNIDTIVLARGHHPELEAVLRDDPAWSLAYEDSDGFVFTRR